MDLTITLYIYSLVYIPYNHMIVVNMLLSYVFAVYYTLLLLFMYFLSFGLKLCTFDGLNLLLAQAVTGNLTFPIQMF